MNILIVDDDPNIRQMLEVALKVSGFECRQASNAYDANDLIDEQLPDAILVDWMMPHLSGVEWIRQKRKSPKTESLPIIMITAKAQEANVISGLNAGADDYIVKPFSPRELIARIQSLIRRSKLSQKSTVENTEQAEATSSDTISFDAITNTVILFGNKIKLGPSELQLLEAFANNPNRPLTRAQLILNMTGSSTTLDERSLDVYIKRLRQSLKAYNLDKKITTIRGYGYQFDK